MHYSSRLATPATRHMPRAGKLLGLLVTPLWLIACVTINVYFPAAAAERAADRIVKEVYGEPSTTKQPAEQEKKAPANKPDKSGAIQKPSAVSMAFGAVLDFMITPAHAQANLDVSTPAIRAITRSLKQRQSQLDPYYRSGAVGVTADGLITIRDLGSVPLKDRNTLKQLVAADNRDRQALYQEIAKANGHPEWEREIRSTFARRWIANAPSGWWYQQGNGSWKQK
jgi:uncharacterized protein YdbL (DUF1318 family)